ncbi:hypothetical protein N7444_001002 [Penicillium canescens]|nr:hypothetical protein N7444_001002 [Penicillium canescens]
MQDARRQSWLWKTITESASFLPREALAVALSSIFSLAILLKTSSFNRNPAKLDFAAAAGATVRKADYDTNADLERPFEDIDTLFLISYASIEVEHRAEVSAAASPNCD